MSTLSMRLRPLSRSIVRATQPARTSFRAFSYTLPKPEDSSPNWKAVSPPESNAVSPPESKTTDPKKTIDPKKSQPISKRWLTELDSHGKNNEALKNYLTSNWLSLVAGTEGFLVGPRYGLSKHAIVWGDQDSMGHVNNVVYNRLAESSRVNWFMDFAKHADQEHKKAWSTIMSPKDVGMILKSIKTDFKFPVMYPDQVTVLHRLANRPDETTESIFMEVLIISHKKRRIAARCFESIVPYDYQKHKKACVPQFMVPALQAQYDKQTEAQNWARHAITNLLQQVKEGSFKGAPPKPKVDDSVAEATSE